MQFQTHKTFVHLWNTIFDEIRELSDPAYTATQLFKPQKGSKDIVLK